MESVAHCQFELKIGRRGFRAQADVPAADVPLERVLPVLLQLTSAVVEVVEDELRQQGRTISCRAGCGACCRQAVPVAECEARWLKTVIDSLADDHRARVLARFADARARLEAAGLWQGTGGYTELGGHEERKRFGIAYFAAGVVCPFLEDESCSIHTRRPMACREYLVTSAAVHCASPTAETIDMVPLPLKPSVALYRFADGEGADSPRYLLLTAAPDWVAHHGAESTRLLPGPVWLENFLKCLADRTNTDLFGRNLTR